MEIIITESASSLSLSSLAIFYSVGLVWEIIAEEKKEKRRITTTTTMILYKKKTLLWSDK
ncbi:MAG: hypothetical protein ACJ702_00340 [Nitrososphaeraceae archaeon]